MASFHRHRYWLLFFAVFLCFLVAHKFGHLVGSLITLELIWWAIILSLFITISSLQAQGRHFSDTVVNCYILKIFYYSSPLMIATTRWYCWLHWKYFADRLFYPYIAIYNYHPYLLNFVVSHFFVSFIPVQWRRITFRFCLLLFLSYFFVCDSDCEASSLLSDF